MRGLANTSHEVMRLQAPIIQRCLEFIDSNPKETCSLFDGQRGLFQLSEDEEKIRFTSNGVRSLAREKFGELVVPQVCEIGLRRLAGDLKLLDWGSVVFGNWYQILNERTRQLMSMPNFKYHLFGVRPFLQDVARGVAKIVLMDANGDEDIGSGFIIYRQGDTATIVTNQHVVQDETGKFREVKQILVADVETEISGIEVIEGVDAALIEVKCEADVEPFKVAAPHLLDEVITAGFPKVARALASPLIFHEGQINAFVQVFGANFDLALISAEVAPGSSGGPVLNDFGEVVGIVTESLERYFAPGSRGDPAEAATTIVQRYHAMIPMTAFGKAL